MTTDDNRQEASAAMVRFERELESLVLEAFARGAVLEREWEIRPRPSAVPNWTVTIERHPIERVGDPEEVPFED